MEQDLNRSPNQEEEEEEVLFEKELTERDIKQGRMFITGKEHKRRVLKALREDEIKKAREKDGLSVATTDANGVEYKLILEMQWSRYMILSHELHALLHKYKLMPGDSVKGFASATAPFRLCLHFIPKNRKRMSKGKGMGGENDGRKRKARSPNQLQIQQDLNHSPNQIQEELLFEKELTRRDVKHWELTISGAEQKKRVLRALREDEKEKARGEDGLRVATTLDADGVEYTLILRIAHFMTLSHQWNNITRKYKPKAGDSLQAFASRHAADHHLRLHLHFITN
ncbi:hypothetical protein SASPL_157539 [Salvia splendens]|uniref:Uncharacterized protein n=1 Tax=Salvia splendens TaxID=180675 RepID=A0A8X8VUR6_SALSN|nr:uncharacterized protein LOC121791880 [Salvia splendens]KAG6382750.1 hypothetical protein SASPL_157539 [Salvia splendens]